MKKQLVDDKNLIGKRRVFDQGLFEKYDIPAREKIKTALNNFVVDNPDEYQQDLIITDETYTKYKYIEIQVFTYWTTDYTPEGDVFVYERKAKYDYDTLFITLNKDMTACMIFDAESFKYKTPRRLKKYSREYVYDIPKFRIVTVKLSRLTPEYLKKYY